MEIIQFGSISILAVFLIIHFGILLKLIPYQMVWGSRMKTDQDMYQFESVSILLNAFFLWVVLEKLNLFTDVLPATVETYLLYGMAALFLLNTLGNLSSKSKVEKFLFTPLALLLAVFCFLLANN